jgi:ABC-2 type transport system permease protein
VRRGGKVVLPGVTLEIRSGAVTGLLGPSGSGKTTLMRAIFGVQIVASGTLTVLRRDRRTIAMVLVVPPLLTLFRYVFDEQPQTFDRIGPPMVGLFPFVIMFLITSIAMLRERTSGTLERLMSLPIAKADLLIGYGIAFALVATIQAIVAAAVAFGLLGLDTVGSGWLVVVFAVANALLGMALGLFLSAFATTEFQAVQFMPAVVLPQFLLCGLVIRREQMARALELLSDVRPLTYAYDALARVTASSDWSAKLTRDLAIVAGCIVLALLPGRRDAKAPDGLRSARGLRRRRRLLLVLLVEPQLLEDVLGSLVRPVERVVEAAVGRVIDRVLRVVDGVQRAVLELVRALLGAPDPASQAVEPAHR